MFAMIAWEGKYGTMCSTRRRRRRCSALTPNHYYQNRTSKDECLQTPNLVDLSHAKLQRLKTHIYSIPALKLFSYRYTLIFDAFTSSVDLTQGSAPAVSWGLCTPRSLSRAQFHNVMSCAPFHNPYITLRARNYRGNVGPNAHSNGSRFTKCTQSCMYVATMVT